jgi:Protein of unknown function (DUF2818)
MNSGLAALALLVMSIALANLPFLTERRFLAWQGSTPKSLGFRFLELAIAYFLALGVGLLLERAGGPVYPQRWEFYGITLCFFIVLAFPGFVHRYLYRRAG